MSIADELVLLANTKESLRVAIGLSTSIPFSQYAVNMPWGSDVIPATGIVFDFKKNRYAKDGKAVYLDDVSEFIRLSSATMWHDEQLVEVQNNIPRISSEGLLTEEQRTNLATWSDDSSNWKFSGFFYKFVGVSFTPTAGGEVYSGTVTQVMEDTSEGTHQWAMASPSSLIGDHHTFSLFIKPASGRGLSVVTNFFTGGHVHLNFDFSTLTVVITGNLIEVGVIRYSEIIDLGQGLYRVVFSGESRLARQASSGEHFGFRLTSSGTTSYVGSGDVSATVFGYQIEQGSFPTSYTPTNGTPVTRSPETLNIPLLPTQEITGDWDNGITYSLADGIATFTGHGYIRNITVEEL